MGGTFIESDIIALAEREFREELFREEVEKYKNKLREKRSFWDRIFPWKLIIIKKENTTCLTSKK